MTKYNYLNDQLILMQIKDDILNERISFSDIKPKIKKIIDKRKEMFNDLGISIKDIKKRGKSIGRGIKKEYDKGKKPEEVAKSLSKDIGKETIKFLKSNKQRFTELSLSAKVITAIVATIVLVFVQAILLVPLVGVVGPKAAGLLIVVALAPLTEETLKRYYINKGMAWSGTGFTFGLEAIGYIHTMVNQQGFSLPAAIILRFVALAMHLITTFVQKLGIDKTTESGEGKYAFIGWVVAVAMHAAWNTFAILSQDQIERILG